VQLLERDAELATLSAAWRRARSGSGSLVLAGGPSGIGKTSLVRAFVDELAATVPVLWGACDPLATPRPLGPLHDMADDLAPAARAAVEGDAASHEVGAALVDDLGRRPAVVVVDDLHWADQATLDVLRFVLRRIARTRALLVGTFRDDEVGAAHPLRALLGDAAASGDAVALTVPALSVEAVAALAGDRPIDAAALHRATGGNAFYVREALDHDGASVPASVRDAVLARASGLDDAARDVLDLMAVAPGGIPDRALVVLGIGLPALRALDATGLVQRGPRGVEYRHEICRLAVADAIPPGGAVSLHARVLDALEAIGLTDPAVLAHHALGAGDEPRLIRHARAAGSAAARAGAHTQAAAFFETALHCRVPDAAERAELLELLSAELYLTDRLDEAIAAGEQAIALRERARDPRGVGADHHALSIYEWYNANRPVAERHVCAAVDVLEPAAELVGLGHAYATQAYFALHAGDLAEARARLDRAHAAARRAGDGRLDARVEIIEAVTAVMCGDVTARERILALIARDWDHFDEAYSSGYSSLAYFDVEQRRLADAGAVLEVSLPLTVERDVPICMVWQRGVRGRMALLSGDWNAAVDDAATVLDGRSAPLARTWPHLVRGLVALRRGDDGADADLEAAFALAVRYGEPLRLLPAYAALAERAWLTGDDDERVDAAAEALPRLAATDGAQWSAGDLAVWLARLGRDVDGAALGLPEPHRLLLSGAALDAAAAWEALGTPYERALALVDADGHETTFAALEVLDRLGADAVAARCRRTLRAAGVAPPTRRRAATRANPAGLTARQVEVLRLLDAGLTNAELAQRLFISAKTVDHHVTAILGKLGISSRHEAGAAARRLGVEL
jgi:ATP/maltotriose-dependent transcriptional regulator MalT